ncbi:MAG: hypothetical protein N2645_02405 [Clostridia bacterium]|nr:hypothetical protein [Clostridia bacterium]
MGRSILKNRGRVFLLCCIIMALFCSQAYADSKEKIKKTNSYSHIINTGGWKTYFKVNPDSINLYWLKGNTKERLTADRQNAYKLAKIIRKSYYADYKKSFPISENSIALEILLHVDLHIAAGSDKSISTRTSVIDIGVHDKHRKYFDSIGDLFK